MPEEEVDQAIESGNLFNTVGLLTAERDKKLLFEDVRLRHEDIVRLEKAIRELHDMFQGSPIFLFVWSFRCCLILLVNKNELFLIPSSLNQIWPCLWKVRFVNINYPSSI
jgi:hypothetical protein